MIAECQCGEILSEDDESCRACGAVNRAHKAKAPPRLTIAIVGGLLIWFAVAQDKPWYWPAAVLMLGTFALRRPARLR